ncbi:hypothetical protein [Dinoroseobacter sp. S124A]|uniref:hypothetical protein n=1 Tax=Dinoroseobacter sp. S124A TaxID=3415128 RepID=UPI003C7DAE86
MPILDLVCDRCRQEIETLIGSDPRQSEVITGDFPVHECCFIRDEIRFLNNGRLIFEPQKRDDNEGDYCRDYTVVCRRLVVVGGGAPITLNPCGPEDPGNQYTNKNVITWRQRLIVNDQPIPNPLKAPDGQDFGNWQDQGQGNSGVTGGAGTNGNPGNKGDNGRFAPNFALIALEVVFEGLDGHLIIDFDGQVGGRGQRGQNGGKGGKGMNGRQGQSDNSWPGEGCDRQPGHGGDGGSGGDGGKGGQGGDGGNAGNITIASGADVIASGIFVGGKFTYVNDGGNEGSGGLGGFGGLPGGGGQAGFKTNQCDAASNGETGNPGFPPSGLGAGSNANEGGIGAAGAAGSLTFETLVDPGCLDGLALKPVVNMVEPTVLCRGFASPANNVSVSLFGQNLAQVTAVSTTLGGVSISIQPTSTDTELKLSVDILGTSDLGPGDLILSRPLASDEVFGNAIEVRRFEVTAVTPNSVARGESGVLNIDGSCFDPSAAILQVNVSGIGVSTNSVVILNDTQIQANFDVGNAAPTGQRDVTVVNGTTSHTLVNALTVTG